MKLIKQHAAALDVMVGRMHADMGIKTSDMRNVQGDACNKLEAMHKLKDDMAAEVEEMKQLRIDIIKYVEKKRRESERDQKGVRARAPTLTIPCTRSMPLLNNLVKSKEHSQRRRTGSRKRRPP